MTRSPEQFMNFAKTPMADFNILTSTGLAGFGKLMALNMDTAQAAMADAAEKMQAGFALRSLQDLGGVSGLAQPMAEKAAAYGRAVAGIVVETGTALSKATEAKFAEVQAQAVASIDAALKNAPAGSEGTVSAFKNAMSTGQAALATVQSQARQAVDAASRQFASATDMAVKAAKTVGKTK